jgi:hypothetical protein
LVSLGRKIEITVKGRTKTHVDILYAIYTRLPDRYTICFADESDPVLPQSIRKRKADALLMLHAQQSQTKNEKTDPPCYAKRNRNPKPRTPQWYI